MPEFYQQTIAETVATLKSDVAQGLSDSEVTQRRVTYGKNALPVAEGTNWLQLVLAQFKDLMVIILIAAAVISAVVGDSKDVVVILAIVILIFGANRLPELGKGIGAGIKNFKSGIKGEDK